MTTASNASALREDHFTKKSLVSFFPCGCWGAVQMQPRALGERATETARFMRDAERDGASRVEEMDFEEWKALRNGVNGDLTHGCDHDPQWGGAESTHGDCPRCHKTVKKLKNGRLAAHRAFGRTWGPPCSQEPWPADDRAGSRT